MNWWMLLVIGLVLCVWLVSFMKVGALADARIDEIASTRGQNPRMTEPEQATGEASGDGEPRGGLGRAKGFA